MISAGCRCGKRVRVDDQFTGRTIRCPACFGPLTIPTADNGVEADDDDREAPVEDEVREMYDSLARVGRGFTTKRVAGGAMVLVGALLAFGTPLGVLTGQVRAGRIHGLMVVYALIVGVGTAWLKGETYKR